MLRYEFLHIVLEVGSALRREVAAHGAGKFHVVVAVDAEYVFHHIAWALHIHAIGWHQDVELLIGLFHYLHFEAREDALDGVLAYVFTYEVVDVVVAEFYGEVREFLILDVDYIAADFAACHFLDEHCSHLEVVDHGIWVDAALKAERGVGVEGKSASRLANPGGVEISRFEEDVGGGFGDAAVEASEHAAYAHRLFGIAYHKVALGEGAFHAIEGDKLSAFGACLHHHFFAFYLGKVEAVQRLVESEKHKVGDIHYVVDRTLTNGEQEVLEPLGAFSHFHVANGHATIARASLGIFHCHLYGAVGTVGLIAFDRWLAEHTFFAVLLEPRSQVASHAVVRSAIYAVRGEVHLYHIIVFDAIVVARRSAHLHIVGQHYYAGVACAYAYLIFGANHATRFHSAYFRFFDYKFLVAIVEFGANSSHYHLLSGSHIRSTAHYLSGFAVAEVNGGDV